MAPLGDGLAVICRDTVNMDPAADVMRIQPDFKHRYQFSQSASHDMLTICVSAEEDCSYAAYLSNVLHGPDKYSFLIDHTGNVLYRSSNQPDWRPAEDRQIIELYFFVTGVYRWRYETVRIEAGAAA